MTARRLGRTGAAAMAFGAGTLVLAGCASTPHAEVEPVPDPNYDRAHWIPAARPAFATIQRDTRFAVVADEYRDLLIVEDDVEGGRLAWLVTIPADPSAGGIFEVGPSGETVMGEPLSTAWLHEARRGAPNHVTDASGSVQIIEVRDDAVVAAFDLAATLAPPSPGRRGPMVLDFSNTVTVMRAAPAPSVYTELDRRGGIDPELHSTTRPPIWGTLFDPPPPPPPKNRFSR